MRKNIFIISVLFALFACAAGIAAAPTINADRTVTFSLRVPYAESVSVVVTGLQEPVAMSRNENGVWSATVGPLDPNIWEYSFVVDGVSMIDPRNAWLGERINPSKSVFEVPGREPGYYSAQDVPHGVVSMHTFKSPSLGEMRTFHVYTPPGYNGAVRETYPVLYLMHGSGNDDRGWTVLGRVHYILDNLIAEQKAVPMVVVIPNGQYPRTPDRNYEAYEQDLIDAIIPAVEGEYRVKTDRLNRGISGLSMGGFHTLYIGVKHPEMFAWLGVFSSGIFDGYEDSYGRYLDGINDSASLFWIGNGDNDEVTMSYTEGLISLLDKRDVKYSLEIYSGGHTWDVWRKCLRDFAPLLFRP